MTDEFTKKFGDIKRLFEFNDQAGLNMRVLLAFLDPEGTFEDLSDEERDRLLYRILDRVYHLRINTPLKTDSDIMFLDLGTSTHSKLYDSGAHRVGIVQKRTDKELRDAGLSQNEIDDIRSQITDRLVDEKPSVDDSFNMGM